MIEFKDKKFDFMGTKYTIKFVDKCPLSDNQDSESFNFGLFAPDKATIYISLKDREGKPLQRSIIEQTVRHELSHLIFFEGQYLSCYNDEPLVEWLGKSIKVLLKNNLL